MLRVILLILGLLYVGFTLEHLPLPELLNWFQPPWIVLIVSCLVLLAPQYFGLWLSIPVGLLLDVEHQQALGTHTVALAVYITLLLSVLRKLSSASQFLSYLVIPAFVLVYQLVICGLAWAFSSSVLPQWWQPVLSSFIVWPWLFGLIRFLVPKLHFR